MSSMRPREPAEWPLAPEPELDEAEVDLIGLRQHEALQHEQEVERLPHLVEGFLDQVENDAGRIRRPGPG